MRGSTDGFCNTFDYGFSNLQRSQNTQKGTEQPEELDLRVEREVCPGVVRLEGKRDLLEGFVRTRPFWHMSSFS